MANFTAIASAGKTLERLLDARFVVDEPVPGSVTNAILVRSDDFALTPGSTLIMPPALSIFSCVSISTGRCAPPGRPWA